MTQPCIAVAVVVVMLLCKVSLQQTVMGQAFAVAPCNATCTKDTAYQGHGQVICSIHCAMQPHAAQRALQGCGCSYTLEPQPYLSVMWMRRSRCFGKLPSHFPCAASVMQNSWLQCGWMQLQGQGRTLQSLQPLPTLGQLSQSGLSPPESATAGSC